MVGEVGHSDGNVQLLFIHSINLPLINAFVPSLSFHSSLWWLVHHCETATALEPLQISPMRLASVPNHAETASVPACEALRVHCWQICHDIRPPRRQYQPSSQRTALCNLPQASLLQLLSGPGPTRIPHSVPTNPANWFKVLRQLM